VSDILAKFNLAAYSCDAALKYYDRPNMDLFESERVILDQLTPQIKGKKILDIGVGGGRTTPFLLKVSDDYTGIDASLPLLRKAIVKYGSNHMSLCDFRDLSVFASDEFDFAMCSFNSLGYVSHRDRLRALSEINRVLKSDGLFVFSTHNRERPPSVSPARRSIKSLIRHCLIRMGHLGLVPLEVRKGDYAMLNDSWIGHHPVFTYYMTIPKQIEQLLNCGFGSTKAYDMQGCQVSDDHLSPWIYYITTKLAKKKS
jgi:ubiquinone/menaquinone biosynthesis C-methylase UbiE